MSALADTKHAVPATPVLSAGVDVLKLGRRGSPHMTKIELSPDCHFLKWKSKSPFKSSEMTRVDLTAVRRIQRGQTTIPFIVHKGSSSVSGREQSSFSVVYENYAGVETTLDVVCADEAQAKTLYAELGSIVRHHNQTKVCIDPTVRYARRQWQVADANGDGKLDFKEVLAILVRLNINLTESFVRQKFAECDFDKSGDLDAMEFETLLAMLSQRSDLEDYWRQLCSGAFGSQRGSAPSLRAAADLTMTVQEFHRFQTEVQKTPARNIDETRAKIRSLQDGDDESLKFAGFKRYLNSQDGSANAAQGRGVYQDMNQPISHYWCASSHNTYCETDQLKGYSSVNRYINDLLKGCRCVELDCWDGGDGEPIIYHGHTLTGQIKFKDVIDAVKEHAFTVSDYPVILSFENHCSIEQQVKMAKYCTTILGDALVNPSLTEDGMMPPLSSCVRKVLIKAKRLPRDRVRSPSSSSAPRLSIVGEEEEDEDAVEQEAAAFAKAAEGAASAEDANGSEQGPKSKKPKKPKVAQQLHDITFFSGIHFKSWQKSKDTALANEMSSFSEPKTEKLIAKDAAAWADYNKRQMSRIYPAGVRVDSSNYDPVPSWCVGSQIVALNYQTPGVPMHLNDGRFAANGGCGYVLKPSVLRDPRGTFNMVSGPFPPDEHFKFKIQIMSAFQLPKPGGASAGEVIDPYVNVEMHGVPMDVVKFRTKTVDNNGFNPVFGETFTFDVNMKSLALMYFSIYDSDIASQDDFIAYAVVPVDNLREGLRTVQLRSLMGGNGGEFQFSSLLVNVTAVP